MLVNDMVLIEDVYIFGFFLYFIYIDEKDILYKKKFVDLIF